ncbi:MAG: tocopherol cyclase family protein, partial [Eubacterium sp.]
MSDYHINTKKTSFFEGWYFKNQTNKATIAFIPSINIDADGKKRAFIQIITDTQSFQAEYPYSTVYMDPENFLIKIGTSSFSLKGISLDIEIEHLKIQGDLSYRDCVPLKYDIMGPFSVIPFMECNHGVLSLSHEINGTLLINEKNLVFDQGIGYIEKDWGHSFPKTYLWTQCNVFDTDQASIMVSIADIPFLGTTFRGCIGVVYYRGVEYRLATYKRVKILKCDSTGVILRQGEDRLEITFLAGGGHSLLAPDAGTMSRTIHEN